MLVLDDTPVSLSEEALRAELEYFLIPAPPPKVTLAASARRANKRFDAAMEAHLRPYAVVAEFIMAEVVPFIFFKCSAPDAFLYTEYIGLHGNRERRLCLRHKLPHEFFPETQNDYMPPEHCPDRRDFEPGGFPLAEWQEIFPQAAHWEDASPEHLGVPVLQKVLDRMSEGLGKTPGESAVKIWGDSNPREFFDFFLSVKLDLDVNKMLERAGL